MDSLLEISPGLMIWTIINFLLFMLIIYKFGGKTIVDAIKSREERIQKNIDLALNKLEAAEMREKEATVKLEEANKELTDALGKARDQGNQIIQQAQEEANRIKQAKLNEAIRDIDIKKDQAIKELRTEVAGLVIEATEKILDETLDKDKHYKLVENHLQKIQKN